MLLVIWTIGNNNFPTSPYYLTVPKPSQYQQRTISFAFCVADHKFKLESVTYDVLHFGAPSYLADFPNPYHYARALRSPFPLHIPRIYAFWFRRLIHCCSTNDMEFSPFIRSSQNLDSFPKAKASQKPIVSVCF